MMFEAEMIERDLQRRERVFARIADQLIECKPGGVIVIPRGYSPLDLEILKFHD